MARHADGVATSLLFASHSQIEIAKRLAMMKKPIWTSRALLSWTRTLLLLALPGLLAALITNGLQALRLLMPV